MDPPPMRSICGLVLTGNQLDENSDIGNLASQQMEINGLKTLMDKANVHIGSLQQVIRRKRNMSKAEDETEEKGKSVEKKISKLNRRISIIIPRGLIRKRRRTPTNKLVAKSKRPRRVETMDFCHAIHGGTNENTTPTVIGMLDTLATITNSDKLAKHMLEIRPSLTNSVTSLCMKKIWRRKMSYHNSSLNMMRSLNVYYSHGVMGKRRYVSVCRANRTSGESNFIPYPRLVKYMQNIDVGILYDLQTLVNDHSNLDPAEDITGVYRDLPEYALHLAKFYLTVDAERIDKLNMFSNLPRKNTSSDLFLMAIGGDHAPLVGTSFLLSFLNVGKRTACSFDNFLIFGSNAKENSQIVKLYINKLLSDIRFLESKVFTIELNGQIRNVEFKLKLLPNDMKMLSFLAGELSNASSYFTTFANVSKKDASDLSKKFAMDGSQFWKPWIYEDRKEDAAKVEKKKAKLKTKTQKSNRNLITQYISTHLKSRQETLPLLEEYIDLARCEPLHMKNNVVKDLFLKLLRVVVNESNLPKYIKKFKDVPEENILKVFILFVKEKMRSNQLGSKLISWFDEHLPSLNVSSFGFRFRGLESLHYLLNFQQLITMVIKYNLTSANYHQLLTIFFRSLALRDLISFSTRVNDITADDINDMYTAARRLFCSSVLYDNTVSPSLWVLCNVAPSHTSEIFEELGYGLGINTMEGREQKHQQILKYSRNTNCRNRWPQIFRHEYIQSVYLRQNGFDLKKPKKYQRTYHPKKGLNLCACSLPLVNKKCEICSSPEMLAITAEIQSFL